MPVMPPGRRSGLATQSPRPARSYILGVYSLYERLTSEFPRVLFESCASGGGRFDPGMLYYAPQCWTSDDSDAAERGAPVRTDHHPSGDIALKGGEQAVEVPELEHLPVFLDTAQRTSQ